jgi:uncharacterized membrane protein YfcA
MGKGVTERTLLVLLIAFAAALLGGMSGGSASALTTPAWLAMGVPLPTAVATDKLAGACWTLLGARNFLAGRPVDWPLLGGMAMLGLLGAWAGTAVTLGVDPALLARLVGALILVLLGSMVLRPGLGATPRPPRLSRAATGAFALPLGFYEGMLGSGNSLAATLLFSGGRGYDLIAALGHYYILAFGWCAFAAALYASGGHFDLDLALPAVIGSCAGGFLGSRVARRHGTGFVRGLFVTVGALLGLKLLLGF